MKRTHRILRFGAFELDITAGELRKNGVRLSLQGKPYQVLEALIARPGEAITRQELRESLWPSGTFVDFDRNVNTAVNKLRDVLGDSARNPHFIETISHRGYRFIAPVERVSARDPLASSGDSIAVLPCENPSADPEIGYLADGITESIIGSLAQLPALRVISRSTVFHYKDRSLDPRTVGRELNVRTVLALRIAQHGNAFVLAAELVDVESGWRLWGRQYRRDLPDISAVPAEIANEIAGKLRMRLTEAQKERLTGHYPGTGRAYRDYLRGRYHWNKQTGESLQKAIVCFEQAIRSDPEFALPYAGLSDVYSLEAFFGFVRPRDVFPKAKEFACKALEIDDSLAEPHVSLAGILAAYEWDWAAAEREYLKALDLSPNHAAARRLYAGFLSATGRHQEAVGQIRLAQELDPLSVVIGMEVAWNLYMARDYRAAIEQCRETLDIEPQFASAHHVLALAYGQLGMYQEAIQVLSQVNESSGTTPAGLAGLGYVYAVSDCEMRARAACRDLAALSARGYVSPFALALVYAGLGDDEAVFQHLARALEERDVWLVWLGSDPRFDRLHSDPRFQNLLARIGLGSSRLAVG